MASEPQIPSEGAATEIGGNDDATQQLFDALNQVFDLLGQVIPGWLAIVMGIVLAGVIGVWIGSRKNRKQQPSPIQEPAESSTTPPPPSPPGNAACTGKSGIDKIPGFP